MKYIIIFFLASSICYSIEIKDFEKQYDKHIIEIKIDFLKKLKKRLDTDFFSDEFLKKELTESYNTNFENCIIDIMPEYAFKDTFQFFKIGDDIIKYIDFSKFVNYHIDVSKNNFYLSSFDMALDGYSVPVPSQKIKRNSELQKGFSVTGFYYIHWYFANYQINIYSDLSEFKNVENKQANYIIKEVYSFKELMNKFAYQSTLKQLYIDNMKEWKEFKKDSTKKE